MRELISLFVAVAALAAQGAVEPEVSEIRKKFDAFRPPSEQLRVYQLDWAPNLQEAKTRAAKEQRPILLVVVRNSYGNMFTGHC